MSGRAKTAPKIQFRTDLDGEIASLPGRSVKSVLGFFAHLENLARHPEGAASVLRKINPGRPGPVVVKNQWTEEPAMGSISFRALGRQVIRAALGQLRGLQERLHEVQSLVLINDWAVAERLWAGLVPDCKTPLFEMSFLEELWGMNPEQLRVGGWSLARQWHQFVLIQAEVEVLLGRRRSLVSLSDTMEKDLGLWLRRFVELLELLDEASAA